MKQVMKNIPLVGPIASHIYRKWMFSSNTYWINRYESGGNSGAGSYDDFAKFKAEILNDFVKQNNIETVIEFGCGDGNQLKLSEYPSYVGFDISPKAVSMCIERFKNDDTKSFKLIKDYYDEMADLALSLDVIYHLIEDRVFADYMHRLFDSANRFVIIYSSETDKNPSNSVEHVKHRKFSNWIDKNRPKWKLLRHIPNRYPFDPATNTGTFADFFIYEKA